MRLLLGTSILLATVAALDAARGPHWDQFAMLVVLGLLSAGALWMSRVNRAAIVPRADLARWVREQSALTDDEPASIVDRALAAYRAQFLRTPRDETAPPT